MSKVNSAIAGAGAGASVGGPWGALIGGVGGYLLGQDDKAPDTLGDLMKQAQQIPLPILKEYYPEIYRKVVSLNPELESAVSLGPSEMAGISTDPAQRQAQLNALNKLQSIGNAGGQDAQFLADQARAVSDVNSNLQGQEGAIQQNLAARGMGGGMSELVQRNLAAQGGANRQAQMGMDAKAQGEQRALQALMQSGTLAGQMQGQDFNQQSAKAQAADAIAKFNAQNTQQVQNNNVNTANNAQQWNAQQQQTVANQNTGLRNEQQQYNNNLAQRNYDNELSKYGLTSNAGNALANAQHNTSKDQDQFMGNLISAGSTAYAANQNKKKDQPPGSY